MLGTELLGTKDATATIAVKNLGAAKSFYEGTLGLTPVKSREGVLNYRSGNTTLFIYESKFAGSNKATSATWVVGDDITGIVSALKSKGVKFEHYDMPGTKLEGDLHVSPGMKVAWLKDPDGNILCIVAG